MTASQSESMSGVESRGGVLAALNPNACSTLAGLNILRLWDLYSCKSIAEAQLPSI